VDDPYALDALYYDIVHAGAPDDDAGLWLSFAGRTNRPVLELGAGTGRIALALAAAGHSVTAVDPSPSMLDRARARATEAGLAIDFLTGTAATVPLPAETFGFVVIPADVFLYCRDAAEQIATLQAVRAAMHFNATLAVDLPGPAAWLDPSLNGQPLLAFRGRDAEGNELEAWHVREDDLATQERLLDVRYETVHPGGAVSRRTSTHRLRYVGRFEMEHLLTLAGLALADVYGDYDLGPLTADSERMIVVARRAGG
jgi:SAM-dependent methyltransferase